MLSSRSSNSADQSAPKTSRRRRTLARQSGPRCSARATARSSPSTLPSSSRGRGMFPSSMIGNCGKPPVSIAQLRNNLKVLSQLFLYKQDVVEEKMCPPKMCTYTKHSTVHCSSEQGYQGIFSMTYRVSHPIIHRGF